MASNRDSSISPRAEILREEIGEILDQERGYRMRKQHSSADEMAHASRELRLCEIRAELEQLQKAAKTAA